MKYFATATDSTGAIKKVAVEAECEQAVRSGLAKRGYTNIVVVTEKPAPASKEAVNHKSPKVIMCAAALLAVIIGISLFALFSKPKATVYIGTPNQGGHLETVTVHVPGGRVQKEELAGVWAANDSLGRNFTIEIGQKPAEHEGKIRDWIKISGLKTVLKRNVIGTDGKPSSDLVSSDPLEGEIEISQEYREPYGTLLSGKNLWPNGVEITNVICGFNRYVWLIMRDGGGYRFIGTNQAFAEPAYEPDSLPACGPGYPDECFDAKASRPREERHRIPGYTITLHKQ